MKRLLSGLALCAQTLALAAEQPSLSPPPFATDRKILRTKAAVFGVCARGTECQSGELWLEAKAPVKRITIVQARWTAPVALSFETFEEHYRTLLGKDGWKVLGVTYEEATLTKHLSAVKLETKKQVHPRTKAVTVMPDYDKPATGVEITMSTTGLDGETERGRLIEYFEGTGVPILAR